MPQKPPFQFRPQPSQQPAQPLATITIKLDTRGAAHVHVDGMINDLQFINILLSIATQRNQMLLNQASMIIGGNKSRLTGENGLPLESEPVNESEPEPKTGGVDDSQTS